MSIHEIISKVYPIDLETELQVFESVEDSKPVKALGTELDRIYNKGGRWAINGIEPTMGEVSQLYDIYKNLVHDHVQLNQIKTVSKTVADILKSLGFKVQEHGVGWVLEQ